MPIRADITAEDLVFFDTDRILEFTVYESGSTDDQIAAGTAVPQDVTGWALGWTMRKKTDGPALISKTTTAGTVQIVGSYDADPNVNTQRVRVILKDTDTYDPNVTPVVNIPAGTYQHGLKRLDAESEDVIAYGVFVLLQAAPWE